MALKGIKVVEMLGLAPGPFCGMILAEFGATVTVVDKMEQSAIEVLSSGKRNVALNLKHPKGVDAFRRLCETSDVVIEPFRPGVMEKLGLGPDVLLASNPRLVYARLSGFGQSGPLAPLGGHDINYVALSGLLSLLARTPARPFPPLNYAADFAGGGLLCAFGIVAALLERASSGRGQVVDCSMTEGTAYVSSWFFRSQSVPGLWGRRPGDNLLDGGAHFYDTYRTKDGKYVAVGAIEPKFYADLLRATGAPLDPLDQMGDRERQRRVLAEAFAKKTRDEWAQIFEDCDACATPVMSLDEAAEHPHNKFRGSFVRGHDGRAAPAPAPRLDRTPAGSLADRRPPKHGEHTAEALCALNYTPEEIRKMHDEGIVYAPLKSNL